MTDNDAPFSPSRLEALLAAYGARSALWPDSERCGAQTLLDTSEVARNLVREEQPLDAWLSMSASPVPNQLLQRLNAIPERTVTPLVVRRFRAWQWWMPALGWATAAAVGFWLGARSVGDTETRDSTIVGSQEASAAGPYDENEQLAIFGSTLVGMDLP